MTPRMRLARGGMVLGIIGLVAGGLVSWSSGCGGGGGGPASFEGGIDLFAKPLALNIKVVERDGTPVFGAEVQVNGVTLVGRSGPDGILRTKVAAGSSALGVRVMADNHVDNIQRIETGGALEVNAYAPLLKVGAKQSGDPKVAVTIFDHDAGSAEFASDQYVIADGGGPVTGVIDTSLTVVRPADVGGLGTFGIKDRPGEALQSLGAVVLSVTSNGVPLKVAPGKKVTIRFPASMGPDAGAPTALPPGAQPPPLWRQNAELGVWEQTADTFALVNGKWEAHVDALGTWNCDYATPVTCARGTVTTPQGKPINAAVLSGLMAGTISGFPVSSVLNATTASGGTFCLGAFPGSQLTLGVACPDGTAASAGPFPITGNAGAQCGKNESCGDLGTIQACCKSDQECGEKKCKRGVCSAGRAGIGERCTTTDDCIEGAECFQGFCVGLGNMRVSLSWSVDDDFDLFLKVPGGQEISYATRSAGGGTLDVDQCVSSCGDAGTHVENIVFRGEVPLGQYSVSVKSSGGRAAGAFTIEVAGKAVANFSGNLTKGGASQEFPFSVTQ